MATAHDRVLLYEFAGGVTSAVKEVLAFFKEVREPRDEATPEEVVETLAASARADTRVLSQSLEAFIDRAALPAPLTETIVAAAARWRSTVTAAQQHAEMCVLRVRQKAFDVAVTGALAFAVAHEPALRAVAADTMALATASGASASLAAAADLDDADDSDYAEEDFAAEIAGDSVVVNDSDDEDADDDDFVTDDDDDDEDEEDSDSGGEPESFRRLMPPPQAGTKRSRNDGDGDADDDSS